MKLGSLKWKPPSENTIDFKLVLRFPPQPDNIKEPNFCAKPMFWLQVHVSGNDNYEPFDELYMDDEEWERYHSDPHEHVFKSS